jgi:2-keto-4-pentenoate hydratase
LRTAHGYKAIGYKIAATNPASRAHLKIAAPFHGRLYDKLTMTSPAAVGEFPFLRVHEPEIAIQIDRDLDPARAPFSADQIAAATSAVLPAIEIIGTPFEPWAQAGAPNLVSDNAAFGYWIMGTPVRDWSGIDLLDGAVALTINGQVKATGKGRNVDDGAFGASAWLANALAARGRGLKAGDYITTGSVTPPIPVAQGQHVIADFGPLGRVELRTSGA